MRSWRSNFDSRTAYELPAGIARPEFSVTNDLSQIVLPNSIQVTFRKAAPGAWEPVVPTAGSSAGTIV